MERTKKPIQPGQKLPFEQVYERYYPSVLRYVQGKLGNLQDAEDLCSEAFLYCLDQYDNYDPGKSAVSTWLYLVVNSRLKNFYRDRKIHTDIDEISNLLPDEGSDLEHGVYLEQLRDMLAKAIATLPEKQQKIVVMSYFQQMTSAQIAEQLGITAGNVRVMLTRALNKLEAQCYFFNM